MRGRGGNYKSESKENSSLTKFRGMVLADAKVQESALTWKFLPMPSAHREIGDKPGEQPRPSLVLNGTISTITNPLSPVQSKSTKYLKKRHEILPSLGFQTNLPYLFPKQAPKCSFPSPGLFGAFVLLLMERKKQKVSVSREAGNSSHKMPSSQIIRSHQRTAASLSRLQTKAWVISGRCLREAVPPGQEG